MVSTFYKGSDGCMLAFDVTDRESFESLDNWRDDFLEKVIPREQDFPMVVLGNKIDICDRQVSVEELGWVHWDALVPQQLISAAPSPAEPAFCRCSRGNQGSRARSCLPHAFWRAEAAHHHPRPFAAEIVPTEGSRN